MLWLYLMALLVQRNKLNLKLSLLLLQNLILKTLGLLFGQMYIFERRENVRDLPVQPNQIVSITIPNLLSTYTRDDNNLGRIG